MRNIVEIKHTGQTVKRIDYENVKQTEKKEAIKTTEKPKRDEAVFTDRVAEGEKLQQLIETLKKEYPQIHFKTEQAGTGAERDIIADALEEMSEGYVLFLSEEFLSAGGKGSYEKKEKMLIECVKRLAAYRVPAGVFLEEDRAVFWQKEKAEEAALGICKETARAGAEIDSTLPSPSERLWAKSGLSVSSSYNVAAAYSRLAGAKTKSTVQTVMQQTRRDITSLKFLSLYGDEKERIKARAAVKSLQKLLLRGRVKIESFEEEHLTDARRKKAERREERKRELQALLELKRHRTARHSRDGAIRMEGRLEKLNVPGYYDREKQKLYASPPMKSAAVETGTSGFGPAESLPEGGTAVQAPAEGFVLTEIVSF
ncbi:hypothetical protein H8S37_10665 [Mediterraneibacter sp. NSJ-55]|uniref:TIR domain-containing protein n=1 Tax=Mediterraneibacter hominis TaxID=2763054 RepID=A0A923LK22_9FIRM|nr:hypothetical protein [Mediterraneibacter hominis]MBC5689379.1 hypothetical protein [Mediterraneibacter hominis]